MLLCVMLMLLLMMLDDDDDDFCVNYGLNMKVNETKRKKMDDYTLKKGRSDNVNDV